MRLASNGGLAPVFTGSRLPCSKNCLTPFPLKTGVRLTLLARRCHPSGLAPVFTGSRLPGLPPCADHWELQFESAVFLRQLQCCPIHTAFCQAIGKHVSGIRPEELL